MADENETTQQAESSSSGSDIGQGEAQARKDEEDAQGFHGIEVDPTPNEHYTVDGVTSRKPTPETDAKAYAEANKDAHLARWPEEQR